MKDKDIHFININDIEWNLSRYFRTMSTVVKYCIIYNYVK